MPPYGPTRRTMLIRGLRTLGFTGPYPGKRHATMERGDTTVIIPNPHRSDIGVNLLRRILRQGGISREEWESV